MVLCFNNKMPLVPAAYAEDCCISILNECTCSWFFFCMSPATPTPHLHRLMCCLSHRSRCCVGFVHLRVLAYDSFLASLHNHMSFIANLHHVVRSGSTLHLALSLVWSVICCLFSSWSFKTVINVE